MAKRITHFSKLSREKKDRIERMLEKSKLKIIEVNLKKGVIFDFDDDEFFVILDTWEGIDKRSNQDDEDDEDDDDEDDDLDLEDDDLLED